MTDFDWSRFRKCSACHAALGLPCTVLTGVVGGECRQVRADRPHGTRRLRAGAVSR